MLSQVESLKPAFKNAVAEALERFSTISSPVTSPAPKSCDARVAATSARQPALLLSDRAGFYDHFTLGSLILRGGITAVNVTAPGVLQQVTELPKDDQQRMEQIIETGDFPDWGRLGQGFQVRWAREFVRSLAITTVHRILESVIVQKMDLEVADTYMRNLKRAAQSEYGNTGDLFATISEIAKLATATYVVGQAACFIVNESFTIGDIIYDAITSPEDFISYVQKCGNRFLEGTGRNLKVSVVTYAALVIGCIGGTMLWPGPGTGWMPQITSLVADATVL